MMRGTFANVRIRNEMADGKEGGWTKYIPDGQIMSIYDAAMKYKEDGVPLVVFAGKDYGMGSSRDWAAKGTTLLGIRAVIAESFERIHRSNLVGMGVLPLQFAPGTNRKSLGLTGNEKISILGLEDGLRPKQTVKCEITHADGKVNKVDLICRIDTINEIEYYQQGGILQKVIRDLAA
jgi:aconitate hydratase